MKILVSACLLGFECRYNGLSAENEKIIKLMDKYKLIPVCPEILGGLPIPREPVQFTGGDGFSVLEKKAKIISCFSKQDKTYYLLRGAKQVLKFVKKFNIKFAIFKDKSPSCGVNWVYIDDVLRKGKGLTTAILLKEKPDIEIFSEEDFHEFIK